MQRKNGRLPSISLRQMSRALPLSASSFVTPQRRSMSTSRNRLSSHHWRNRGKVTLMRWSRSACMSRNVLLMKTRAVFQEDDTRLLYKTVPKMAISN